MQGEVGTWPKLLHWARIPEPQLWESWLLEIHNSLLSLHIALGQMNH